MSGHERKAALFDAIAEVAKAMASGRRAELVEALAQGERSVESLSVLIGQSVANTSQHLQRLLRAGLVTTRRDGTRILYALASPAVYELWHAMMAAAEAHTARLQDLVEAFVGDRDGMRSITRDELARRMHEGDVVVLDVRPEPEFRARHIRGALSIPIAQLASRLDDVPIERDIVAYCRGPYCVLAYDAVRYLTRHGRSAIRLEGGLPEWAMERRPVASA